MPKIKVEVEMSDTVFTPCSDCKYDEFYHEQENISRKTAFYDKFKSIGEIPCEKCIYFHNGCEDFRSDDDCVEKIIRLSLEKVGIKIN